MKIKKTVFSDNKAIFKNLIEKVYKAVLDLPTEELLLHYEEVKEELKKRGVKLDV